MGTLMMRVRVRVRVRFSLEEAPHSVNESASVAVCRAVDSVEGVVVAQHDIK